MAKCNHEGYWKSAGNAIIQGSGVAILINTFFCEKCGFVKRDEFNYPLPKVPPNKDISLPRFTIPVPNKKI